MKKTTAFCDMCSRETEGATLPLRNCTADLCNDCLGVVEKLHDLETHAAASAAESKESYARGIASLQLASGAQFAQSFQQGVGWKAGS